MNAVAEAASEVGERVSQVASIPEDLGESLAEGLISPASGDITLRKPDKAILFGMNEYQIGSALALFGVGYALTDPIAGASSTLAAPLLQLGLFDVTGASLVAGVAAGAIVAASAYMIGADKFLGTDSKNEKKINAHVDAAADNAEKILNGFAGDLDNNAASLRSIFEKRTANLADHRRDFLSAFAESSGVSITDETRIQKVKDEIGQSIKDVSAALKEKIATAYGDAASGTNDELKIEETEQIVMAGAVMLAKARLGLEGAAEFNETNADKVVEQVLNERKKKYFQNDDTALETDALIESRQPSLAT